MTRVPILPARGCLRLVCILFVLEILSQALWTHLSLGDLDLFKKKNLNVEDIYIHIHEILTFLLVVHSGHVQVTLVSSSNKNR